MDQATDKPDEKITTTIKGLSSEAWARANRAKLKSGETMGAWLTRAINQLANLEEGNRETFPDERGKPDKPEPLVYPLPPTLVNLHQITEAMRAAKELAEISGEPLPRTIASHSFILLNSQLRMMRGMAPLKPRRRDRLPAGQTLLPVG